MPPRKEPKETVVYPASKRKALPFKPQRPSKVPRTSTTESESYIAGGASRQNLPATRTPSIGNENDRTASKGTAGEEVEDSDEELAEDPLAARPRPVPRAKPPRRSPKRRISHAASPLSVTDDDDDDNDDDDNDDDDNDDDDNDPFPQRPPAAAEDDIAPLASQNDSPSIPQPLLIRLLHEHFADKATKIDKHAVQVLQKYVEIFVREAIARTAAQKKLDAETGGRVSEVDAGWLELEDLEKVAGGMMLDF